MTFKEALTKAHVAKLRNNYWYLIFRYDNYIRLVRSSGWTNINDTTEGLCEIDHDFDIVELHTIPENTLINTDKLTKLLELKTEIIWKRDTRELTIKEIADKFGIPVECLRIKQ